MARTAVLTKEQIVESAFKICSTEGRDSISIRSIATVLATSTAPIYTQYPSIDCIYEDLAIYVENKFKESTTLHRTNDSFLDIGVGILAFALDYKLVFTDYFLTKDQIIFDYTTNEELYLKQMRKNMLLNLFDDERLRCLLCDMWVFTYGLATMICNGLETSNDLEYYQNKLEGAGNKLIIYHMISSGNLESFMHNMAQSFNQKFQEGGCRTN